MERSEADEIAKGILAQFEVLDLGTASDEVTDQTVRDKLSIDPRVCGSVALQYLVKIVEEENLELSMDEFQDYAVKVLEGVFLGVTAAASVRGELE